MAFAGCLTGRSYFTESGKLILKRSTHHFNECNLRLDLARRVRSVIVQVMLLLSVTVNLASTLADDTRPAEPLHLEVLQLTSQPKTELLTRFRSQLSLNLRVTNQSGSVLTLKRSQLQLKCEDQSCSLLQFAPPNLLLKEEQDVTDGETIEGWISFQVSRPTSSEPALEFIWNVNDTAQSIDLNQELRRLIQARMVHIGYQNRIAVLSINRTIDLMTMWVLDEQFRSLKKQGVERLVLAANAEKAKRLPGPIANWLQLANGTAQTSRRTTVRGFPVACSVP